MGVMAKGMKTSGSCAIALAAVLVSKVALAATAIGHVSVTILPSVAAVSETAPIEMDGAGNRIAAHAGIVTLTGAPNSAVSISVALNDTIVGSGPALQFGRFAANVARAPVLSSNGSLSFSVGAMMKPSAVKPHGTYAGSYSVTVNY
jgi:hypothetical protein